MTELRKVLVAVLTLSLPISALAQAPAAAPAPVVQVYGTFNVNLQYTEAGDATAGSAADVSARWAVSSDSSNVGVRGSVDVAHGLKAIYQCESSAGPDATAATFTFCGRNSRVGVSGGFGTLFYGNWDTPFKAAAYGTKAEDPFGNTDVFAYQGIMGSPGFLGRSGGWSGAPTHVFDLRGANSVAYWTPKFSGLSAKLQWATDETKTANGIVNPTLYGAAINYDAGGLSVFATVEQHEDGFGLRAISGANAGNFSAKDFAWRVGAGYELPLAGLGALTVSAMVEQLTYAQDDAVGATDLEDYDRMAWLIGAKFRAGSHEFRARYAQAMEPSCTIAGGVDCPDVVTQDLGASQLAAGYAYHLAKSTQVYAFYTQIMNDDDARYTFSIGGSGPVTTAPAGADPSAFGIGIRHAF